MMRILIVDDAMFMREVIGGILRSGGYTDLLEAEDGVSALACYVTYQPDLVLLDITMPGMDGLETLRCIKAINAEAKVVMCSAIGQERQMLNAIELGAADYIVKPFKPETMLQIIRRVTC